MDYVSRKGWGARAPKNSPSRITQVRGIAVHWNGLRMGIKAHAECAARIRGIQNFHMNTRGWADIAYSWFVCPHGTIYEGRGWGNRTAANGTNFGNDHYHAVYFLGGPGEITDAAKRGLRTVIDESKRRYGNEVRPHSWFKSTDCPGNELRAWIRAGLPVATPTEPNKTDEWENLWMSLNADEKRVLQQLASELAGPNGVENGASFARQFLLFHRNERPQLKMFLDEVKNMNSSIRGQVRAATTMWREAGARGWKRDTKAVSQNKAYTAEELKLNKSL